MAANYRDRGGWHADDGDDNRITRPSGGGVGSSSIAYESGRRRAGRGRLLTQLVVLVAVGGFAAVVWNAYNQGQSNGDAVVPLIQADSTPSKVRPEQPGGMDVPNQDKLIYDRLTPGQTPPATIERLLPLPESPAARPEPMPPPPPQQTESLLPAEIPVPVPTAPVATANAGLEPPPIAARPPAAPIAPPARTASLPSATAPMASGSVRVQLAAVRSQDAAQKEWTRLRAANKDLLGGLRMTVAQADLGDRGTFYRIQAGPVGDQQAATELCAKLKARNVSCLVVR